MKVARLVEADEDASREVSLSREIMRELRSISPEAEATHEPRKLEPHGHGVTLKSREIRERREAGERVERIRDEDEREVRDNYSHASDYSAGRGVEVSEADVAEAEAWALAQG